MFMVNHIPYCTVLGSVYPNDIRYPQVLSQYPNYKEGVPTFQTNSFSRKVMHMYIYIYILQGPMFVKPVSCKKKGPFFGTA